MSKKEPSFKSVSKTSLGTMGIMVLAVLANAQTIDCKQPQNQYKKECKKQDTNTTHNGGGYHGTAYYPGMYGSTMSRTHTDDDLVKKTVKTATVVKPVVPIEPAHTQSIQPAHSQVSQSAHAQPAPVTTAKSSFFSSSSHASVSSSFGG